MNKHFNVLCELNYLPRSLIDYKNYHERSEY